MVIADHTKLSMAFVTECCIAWLIPLCSAGIADESWSNAGNLRNYVIISCIYVNKITLNLWLE